MVLLTQVGESGERAIALDEGADDYLNKPFDPYELLARLRAVLRRARPGRRPLSAAPTLRAGDLRMDRISRRAWLKDAELVLTPKAALLLDYLITHPDELMTRDRLLEVVWGFDFPVGTRAVDNRIAELRRALGDDPAPTAVDSDHSRSGLPVRPPGWTTCDDVADARIARLRVLVPVAAGSALSVALQAAEPGARLYATVSPSLLAGLAGLLGSGFLALVTVMRQRAGRVRGRGDSHGRCARPRPRPPQDRLALSHAARP